jgi:hypothetical protein
LPKKAYQIKYGVLLALDDVPVPHAVSSNVPLPVDGVEILVLANTRDIIRVCNQWENLSNE